MIEYKTIESSSRKDLELVNTMVNQGWRLITIVPSTVPNCQSFMYWFERNKTSKNTFITKNNGNVYVN